MIFKTFKKTDTGAMSCPCIIVKVIVQDRVRRHETVKDHVRPSETVFTSAHEVHSTSELNGVNIVYQLYEIELEQKSVGT